MAKILILDDKEMLRTIGKRFIQALGYEAFTAKDGEEALGVISKESPDLIISDTELEREFGYGVYREARQIHPELKVIATSGKFVADKEGRVIGDIVNGNHIDGWNEVGAHALLAKPYKINELESKIKDVLGGY